MRSTFLLSAFVVSPLVNAYTDVYTLAGYTSHSVKSDFQTGFNIALGRDFNPFLGGDLHLSRTTTGQGHGDDSGSINSFGTDLDIGYLLPLSQASFFKPYAAIGLERIILSGSNAVDMGRNKKMSLRYGVGFRATADNGLGIKVLYVINRSMKSSVPLKNTQLDMSFVYHF
ncbi:outer membrane beta-barrel protein [Vibrio rotiferianus]|uniref:outer membrane beta-barrel protein n=1 Tax=Vibrio rotiferianus TaxID=190895 RepID=UPI00406A56C7